MQQLISTKLANTSKAKSKSVESIAVGDSQQAQRTAASEKLESPDTSDSEISATAEGIGVLIVWGAIGYAVYYFFFR